MKELYKKKNRNQRRNYQKGSNSEIVYEIIKRFIDIVLCCIGLCFAIPLIIIFGLAVRIESRGSCFYRQERMGKNKRHFMIYKLRSMYIDAEKHGAKWADKDDPRVTRVGKVMRKTRIDELPQLVNIIKGDMSIVGPRPERPCFVEKFIKEIPCYEERFKVQCGLTGWAQVNGGYELSPAEKLKEDLYYIENRSLKLDLEIILKTVIVVLTGRDAR